MHQTKLMFFYILFLYYACIHKVIHNSQSDLPDHPVILSQIINMLRSVFCLTVVLTRWVVGNDGYLSPYMILQLGAPSPKKRLKFKHFLKRVSVSWTDGKMSEPSQQIINKDLKKCNLLRRPNLSRVELPSLMQEGDEVTLKSLSKVKT